MIMMADMAFLLVSHHFLFFISHEILLLRSMALGTDLELSMGLFCTGIPKREGRQMEEEEGHR